MRHHWLLLVLLALVVPLHLVEPVAAAPKEAPAVTILYTTNTFGKLRPCPV